MRMLPLRFKPRLWSSAISAAQRHGVLVFVRSTRYSALSTSLTRSSSPSLTRKASTASRQSRRVMPTSFPARLSSGAYSGGVEARCHIWLVIGCDGRGFVSGAIQHVAGKIVARTSALVDEMVDAVALGLDQPGNRVGEIVVVGRDWRPR